MTEKELRKLSRRDLLEMLIYQTKRAEDLELKLNEAQKQLDDNRIALNRAGSIAQASLQVSKIFEAADEAAYRFLESVKNNLCGEENDPVAIYESLRYLDECREGKNAKAIINGDNSERENTTDGLRTPVSIEEINRIFGLQVADEASRPKEKRVEKPKAPEKKPTVKNTAGRKTEANIKRGIPFGEFYPEN